MAAAVEIAVRGTAIVYALVDGRDGDGRARRAVRNPHRRSVRLPSPLHPQPRGEALLVTDLESANGTFLNERPMQSASAAPGDSIRVGSTVLEYRDPAASRRGGTARVVAMASSTMSVGDRASASSRARSTGCRRRPGAATAVDCCSGRSATSRRCTASRKCWPAARDLQALAEAMLGPSSTSPPPTAPRSSCGARHHDRRRRGRRGAPAESEHGAFTVSRTLVADIITKGVSTFAHDASIDERFASGHSVIGQRHPVGDVRAAADDRRNPRRALRRQPERAEPVQRGGPRAARRTSATRPASRCTACG